MSGRTSDTPDPALVAEIRRVIDTSKAWVATGEMVWVDAGGRPKGFRFRERLVLLNGTQPATLFVDAYYKTSGVQGCSDKLSLSLCYLHHRIFAVDENGPSRHMNVVGVGRQYYGQQVGHPQVHTVSDDCIYGYAEPLQPMSFEDYWSYFVNSASITGAPPFRLPTQQLGLPV